jgi:hypothetical protein
MQRVYSLLLAVRVSLRVLVLHFLTDASTLGEVLSVGVEPGPHLREDLSLRLPLRESLGLVAGLFDDETRDAVLGVSTVSVADSSDGERLSLAGSVGLGVLEPLLTGFAGAEVDRDSFVLVVLLVLPDVCELGEEFLAVGLDGGRVGELEGGVVEECHDLSPLLGGVLLLVLLKHTTRLGASLYPKNIAENLTMLVA